MNTDIYNEKVANFQLNVKNLQTEILEKEIHVENFFQLQAVMQKVGALWEEYEAIYYNIKNPKSQENLLVYLENETEFLKIFTSLLNNVEQYHKAIGDFIEKAEMQKIWQDIYTIVELHNTIEKWNHGLENVMEKTYHYSIKTNQFLYNQEYNLLSEKIEEAEKEKTKIINNIEELGSAQERQSEMYQKSKRETHDNDLRKKSKDALKSFENLLDKMDSLSEQNFLDFTEEEQKELKKEDIQLDENYLKTLSSLSLQMEYVKTVIANIENVKGKKITVDCKGKSKRIAKKKPCISSWVRCQTVLRKLTKQYEEEISALSLVEEMEKEGALTLQKAKEEYASLYEELQAVERCLSNLAKDAKEYLGTKEVVAVASLNKEPLYVRKKSLDRFNSYFLEYKHLQNEIKKLINRNDLEEIPPFEKFEEIQIAEQEIYNQISFLNEQKEKLNIGESTEEFNSQLSKLRRELYRMNKGRKFAIFANLKVLFKSLKLTEDISILYASISENPEKFISSKKYTTKEKKQILQDILVRTQNSYLNESMETDNLFSNPVVNLKKKNFFREQFSKVRREFQLLPKNEKKASRIKAMRNPIDKKKLAIGIASVATLSACVVGLLYYQNNNVEAHEKVIASTLETIEYQKNTYDTKIESQYSEKITLANVAEVYQLKNLEQEHKKEVPKKEIEKSQISFKTMPEKESVSYEEVFNEIDFGDSFTKEGEVYKTASDAFIKENAYSTYYDKDTLSTVEGIVFKYNDTLVPIYSYQEDADALKIALLNNGAEQVGVLGKNENTTTNDYEGYFNVEDVHFVLEEAELMNGRGR